MMGYNFPCKRLLFRGASFPSVALCKEPLDQACFRSALCLEHHISIYSALRNDSCIPRHCLKDSRNGRIVPPFNFELSVVQAMAGHRTTVNHNLRWKRRPLWFRKTSDASPRTTINRFSHNRYSSMTWTICGSFITATVLGNTIVKRRRPT